MSESIVLDTNLLTLVVVGTVAESEIPRCKRTASFTPLDFHLLLSVLMRFRHRVACAGVLAETCNLLETDNNRLNGRLFECLRSMVVGWEHPEVEPRAVLNSPVFLKFGFTDASIAHLAMQANTLVLTADAPLYARLSGMRPHPRVENFNHFRFRPEAEKVTADVASNVKRLLVWRHQCERMQ